jgi:serine/threonine protein kinase/Leucine-rich repeat (LRR) protein
MEPQKDPNFEVTKSFEVPSPPDSTPMSAQANSPPNKEIIGSDPHEAILGFGPPLVPNDIGSLGPYRIVKELGRGGMGAVYDAIDTRLERRLALKVMLAHFAAMPDAKARFLREARTAARIKNDHIVTIYQADEHNGIPYISMEFLEGSPLDEYLKKKGSLSIRQIVQIASEIATGLAAAHAVGLVHRDIKPSNLWVEAPNGRIKLLDFGLAKPIHADIEVTQSGAIVGTPAYMSPEQARGEKVDHRSDLFSLGVLLYRLCANVLPFEGPNTMAILMALGTKEPLPVRDLNPLVPEPLAELMHQLLSKNPDNRPQSAEEVRNRLLLIAQSLTASHTLPAVTPLLPLLSSEAGSNSNPTPVQPANPFVGIDAVPNKTKLSSTAVQGLASSSSSNLHRSSLRQVRWFPIGLALGVLLILGITIVVIMKSKNDSVTQNNPPEKVPLIQENPKAKPPNKSTTDDESKPKIVIDPDRMAAEYALSIGGSVGIHANNQFKIISQRSELPQGPFVVTDLMLSKKGIRIDDENLSHFQDCKHLERLDLAWSRMSDVGLAYFQDCQELKEIILTETKLTDKGLSHLKDCTNVQILFLTGTQVSDVGLDHLKNFRKLRSLDLNRTQVTPQGVEQLRAALPNCKIHFVAPKNQPPVILDPDRKGAEFVISAGGAVKIHFNGFDRDYMRIADLPKEKFTLKFVMLPGKKFDEQGLKNLKDCKNIESIHLQQTSVTDVGLENFKNCKNLDYLNLSSTRITDEGLANFKDCHKLKGLYLSDTMITDLGIAYFKECPLLTHLEISRTKVTDAGLAHFQNCNNLKYLYLTDTSVTDKGLAYFKDCNQLLEISLVNLKISGKGLASFKNCNNLKLLQLSGCPITDDDLKELKNFKSLGTVIVRNTAVTLKGIEELHQALPTCTINHDGGLIKPKK